MMIINAHVCSFEMGENPSGAEKQWPGTPLARPAGTAAGRRAPAFIRAPDGVRGEQNHLLYTILYGINLLECVNALLHDKTVGQPWRNKWPVTVRARAGRPLPSPYVSEQCAYFTGIPKRFCIYTIQREVLMCTRRRGYTGAKVRTGGRCVRRSERSSSSRAT